MEKQALQTAMRRRAGEALALYALWTGATWLLEGLPGTLLRSDAAGLRLAYAAIANLGIGIALAAWMIRRNLSDHRPVSLQRMLVGIAVAALAGYALFRSAHPRTVEPIVFINIFAQVWVVSAAEIMVCWALVGGTMSSLLKGRGSLVAPLASASAASLLFGLYHFAHSPPFNEVRMVVFLTGIGLATSVFWLLSRDPLATTVFHNFFAVTGVLGALEAGGAMPARAGPSISVIITALLAAGMMTWAALRKGR